MEVQESQVEQPAKPILPLFILLALASALGVAVAVVLAGIAMLLAAPAYADEGALLLERPAGLVHAECVLAESESLDDGQTRVVEVYQNPYPETLAGVYLYRLPQPGVVERLSFSAGAGEAVPAVFTVRQGTTLVERTARIGPGETLVVELEYRPAGRFVKYRWPS